jgi:uncharacterized protein (DUF2147 family)
MRLSFLLCCGMVLAASPSLAAEPLGDWLVENKGAQIKIENCGGALWGVVSWETKPGQDTENPDPALRGRPTLGMPILIDMKPTTTESWGKTEQRWKGQVYNAQNGKTYEANIRLQTPDVLKIEGCVLGGIFCGGQEWTRVSSPNPPPAGQPKGNAPKSTAKGAAPASDVCSRVANLPGRTH